MFVLEHCLDQQSTSIHDGVPALNYFLVDFCFITPHKFSWDGRRCWIAVSSPLSHLLNPRQVPHTMYKLSILLGLLASVTPSLAAAAASSAEVHRYGGEVNKGSYIVKLRDGAQKTAVMSRIGSFLDGNTKITHDWNPSFFNGFAGSSFHPCACVVLGPNRVVIGNFGDDIIEVLKSNIDVEYIAEDGIMSALDVDPAVVIQYVELLSPIGLCRLDSHARTDAPWGLARISNRARLVNQDPFALDYEYRYLPNQGREVDIYVVDTGSVFSSARVLRDSQRPSVKVSS